MEHIPRHRRTWCSLVWTVSEHAMNMFRGRALLPRNEPKIVGFQDEHRHSLPQNASSAQPRRQFVPQPFFLKLSNIMFVAAVVAVPQNMFDSLYRL